MIFTFEHIKKIWLEQKTQTRRANRGYYQVESERKKPHKTGYAVQRKRGAKAEPDRRIVMDRIWKEVIERPPDGMNPSFNIISEADARAEGGYTPAEFEMLFRELNPGWIEIERWAFEFHVIKGWK